VKEATITEVTPSRYHRQILLPQIGEAGQARLGQARVLLVGCGALGSTIAEQLARSGIGFIRIADRDIVELTNLQRQVLFDETDALKGLPKAIAAAQRLAKINSGITVEPRVVDVDAGNIEKQSENVDLILDGTDNVQTRYLINDFSVKCDIPWLYGACVATEGRVMAVRPGIGPCLRCIFPEPPDPRELATCDTAGVLGPVAAIVGAMEALAAIKLLSGNESAIASEMLSFDLWSNHIRSISTSDGKRPDCPACGQRQFQFLDSSQHDMTARLCGRNAVQVRSASAALSLPDAARRLQGAGQVQESQYMVRCTLAEGGLSLTAFEDGRIIVQGTSDPARARSVVARCLGS
jgi:molybdopterin-synthase adenylyltransferase